MRKRLTTQEFIERANKVHNRKYDYSKVEYIKSSEKVCIICPIHGEFWQTPNKHLNKRGCPECRRENLKSPICGVAINDNKISVYKKGEASKSYDVWIGMINRCYNPKGLKKRPTYRYCVVCKSWLKYSNFKKWFDKNYIDGYQLDKDILIQGNLTYSPETCCFVPPHINTLIIDCAKRRGLYKLGVRKLGNKFIARTHIAKKAIYLGIFDTEDEAHEAYKKAKYDEIKRVAKESLEKGDIDERVYNALLKWKIYEY